MDIPEQKPTKKTDNTELPAQKPALNKKAQEPPATQQESNPAAKAKDKPSATETKAQKKAKARKETENKQKQSEAITATVSPATEVTQNYIGEKPIFIDEIEGDHPHFSTPSNMPRRQKLFLLGVGIFLVSLCVFAVMQNLHMAQTVRPMSIKGENYANLGIYDPSIAYDSQGSGLWMAYAAINQRLAREKGHDMPDINIHMANSFDRGKRWSFSHALFTGKHDTLTLADGSFSDKKGTWRYEAPSLVYDDSDPEQPWKVFAYKYFWTGDINEARKYSAIVYKSAKTMNTHRWTNETWLFTANKNQLPPPYNSLVSAHLNDLHPSLKDMKYYAEVGALAASDGVLLMTLTAFKDDKQPDRIILIFSPDKGKSWHYLGTPITSEQAQHYGDFTRVSGSSLVEQQKRIYLMVSFGDNTIEHQGTHVFEFERSGNSLISKNMLKKDKQGFPDPVKVIEPTDAEFLGPYGGGQSAYHPKLRYSGVLMPQMMRDGSSQPFKIYKTLKHIVGDDE